ncbi:F0F1 ATP synthase subunit A [Amycolatopsis aidingensis]|uniref:F0F1 ATP synthase subunit A n=1 Tax=Amycolatopsis aidingensis TaxID=2842453 RepID=UPI001C0CAB2A|nr:F0F1 ATP synthase subunit A [Amycolatopsis aidingensis]
MGALVLAEGGEFVPPGVETLFPPAIGLGITKPMVLLVLALVIVSAFFLLSSRNLKLVPGKFQFAAESVYDLARNNIARDQIGSKDFRAFIPLILALFSFILVNNLFGIIPLVQFPTFAHFGFPLALSLLVVYPVYHFVGFRRHGFGGYLKHQLMPPGAPGFVMPLLIVLEFVQKFVFNPITLAIRVFAAMFAGHLLLALFAVAGEYLVVEAGAALKPVGVVSFLFGLVLFFVEALIQVVQAYVFAVLSAGYIGMALAEDH